MKDGRLLYAVGGRPRAIDIIGLSAIQSSVNSPGGPVDLNLTELIRFHHAETVKRKHPKGIADEDIKEVSRRSLGRYRAQFSAPIPPN